jgi:menaquinone-dependent protoporphyrinogen IX oxidase
MKGIVIHKGKYGATRQYAEILGSTAYLPVVTADNIHSGNLSNYDFVVLGSSVYMGKLQIVKWLKENMNALIGRKLFFFIVCGTMPNEKEKLDLIIRQNIPPELKAYSEIFFLRGRMIKAKLSRVDRFLLRMGAFFTRNPTDRRNMLTDFDEVKIENILPLQNAIAAFVKKRKLSHVTYNSIL